MSVLHDPRPTMRKLRRPQRVTPSVRAAFLARCYSGFRRGFFLCPPACTHQIPIPYQRCIAKKAGAFTNLPTAARWFPRKWDAAVSTARIAELRQASLLKKESLMTALIPRIDQDSLISRRSIFIGAAASLICAPAIVRVTKLMPVRRLPFPYGPQYAGYVDRLFLHLIESSLQAALRTGQTILVQSFYRDEISVEGAQRTVAFAQAHGWLPPYICIYRND